MAPTGWESGTVPRAVAVRQAPMAPTGWESGTVPRAVAVRQAPMAPTGWESGTAPTALAVPRAPTPPGTPAHSRLGRAPGSGERKGPHRPTGRRPKSLHARRPGPGGRQKRTAVFKGAPDRLKIREAGSRRRIGRGDRRRIRARTAPPAALISDFVASDHWHGVYAR
ncbi:hypothetical protein [Streptomyces europaeiscabiei]|uniref:hypothetical protein n=1 Tax=Streptomyces europaeiscabiei TaxID=146819 RepID=UPI002E189AE6